MSVAISKRAYGNCLAEFLEKIPRSERWCHMLAFGSLSTEFYPVPWLAMHVDVPVCDGIFFILQRWSSLEICAMTCKFSNLYGSGKSPAPVTRSVSKASMALRRMFVRLR